MAGGESARAGGDGELPCVEVHLLGGLAVRIDGTPVSLPAGAVSVAIAVLALRRVVHVEELTEVLWPDAMREVARRRLRNVLARVRRATGPLLVRRGERLELAAGVVVDHHLLEDRTRRALAAPAGPERAAEVHALLEAHRGPLLPELLYEEWAQPARQRAEVRCDELRRALRGLA